MPYWGRYLSSLARKVLLTFVTLSLQSAGMAQSLPGPSSGINISDTYIVMDVTVQHQATIYLDQSVYDATTGAYTSSMNVSEPDAHFHVEAGYDTNDQMVVNLYPTDAAVDGTQADADNIGAIRVTNGNVVLFDQTPMLYRLCYRIMPQSLSRFGI